MARDTRPTPREVVDESWKANKLSASSPHLISFSWCVHLYIIVSGIGHKIKSVNNPDLRVELVKEYVRKNFPSHSLLDYALAVEKATISKKDPVR
jgi:ATP citrate (pro-S)-lyase